MSKHIAFIKTSAGKQFVTLRNELKHKRRQSKSPNIATKNTVDSQAVIKDLREECVIVNGKVVKVRRCFVETCDSGDYSKVGWVLTDDVDNCMVCATTFGNFNSKHHCRACGNIVCGRCSDGEIALIEIALEVGPVKVCTQCYWGQAHVSANFNHTQGQSVIPKDDEHLPGLVSATIEKEAVSDVNLRLYGKISMQNITPAFAIKSRRHDRSVVYINICTCSEVPYNSDGILDSTVSKTDDEGMDEECNSLIYMVCGPAKHSENEMTPSSSGGGSSTHSNNSNRVIPHSIYDVAVNPRVIQDALDDLSSSKMTSISRQALNLLTSKAGECSFSVFQYTSAECEGHYVTEDSIQNSHHIHSSEGGGDHRESLTDNITKNDPNFPILTLQIPKHIQLNSTPQLAIPSPLAFKKLQHILSRPEEIAERPPLAESEVEYDNYMSSPCSERGEYMSMVHRVMTSKQHAVPPVTISDPDSNPHHLLISEQPANSTHHTLISSTKSLTFIANAGFVIKTRRNGDTAFDLESRTGQPFDQPLDMKVFINVMHHPAVDDLLANGAVVLKQSEKPLIIIGDITYTTDKDGYTSLLYNVVVGSEYFKPVYAKDETKISDPVYVAKIIASVNKRFNDCMSEANYSLPRVKNGHKGDSIELMTYTFHTAASDPVVAIVHDINANKEYQQRAAKERETRRRLSLDESHGGSGDRNSVMESSSSNGLEQKYDSKHHPYFGGRPAEHSNDNDDNISVISEVTHDYGDDNGSQMTFSHMAHANQHQTAITQRNAHRRSTLRLSLFAPSVSTPPHNAGQALLTSDDMVIFMKHLSLAEKDVVALKKSSIADPRILLGWQVLFYPKPGQDATKLPVHVVTGMRKEVLTRKTEYRISGRDQDDYWTKLKRSDNKSGVVFWPLRKVLFLDNHISEVEKEERYLKLRASEQ